MMIDSTETLEGAFCAWPRICFDSIISQESGLEAGRTYRVTSHTHWAEAHVRPL